MKKGQVYEGVIESVEFPNKGIVNVSQEDRRVIVKNGVPGQKVRFSVNKVKKGKAEGRILEVIEKAPQEIEPACPKCGQEYPMEYIRDSKKTPRCRNCNNVVRPGVTLYGEQLDSHLTSLAATEVEKAEVLLLLGTKLSSDVYSNYVKFFEGEQIVVIHEKEHYTDCKADIVIYDQPGKVLSNLGYDF